MSADNAIYVQRRTDDKWHVWYGFASSHFPDPKEGEHNHLGIFNYRGDALAFAHDVQGERQTEYGVRQLKDE